MINKNDKYNYLYRRHSTYVNKLCASVIVRLGRKTAFLHHNKIHFLFFFSFFFLLLLFLFPYQDRSKTCKKLITKQEAGSPMPEQCCCSQRWQYSSSEWEAQLQPLWIMKSRNLNQHLTIKLLAISKSTCTFSFTSDFQTSFDLQAPQQSSQPSFTPSTGFLTICGANA